MPRANRSYLEGYRECRESLQELSRGVQRNVGKRALQATAQTAVRVLKREAPVSADPYNKTPGSLRDSVNEGKSRSERGRPRHAIFIDDVAAAPVEFGTSRMEARPWVRAAIDAARPVLARVMGRALKEEVDKAAQRAARKAARAKG